jgi:steroid delta-isomerase-like uncharacterized protein
MTRFIEQFQSGGDETVAGELLAPNFVDHIPFPGFGNTRHDVINLFRGMRRAFPDLRAEVHTQFAHGDRVATSKTFHGTHEGPFAGIEPTQRRISIRVMDIVRIENGAIRDHWNVVDVDGFMRQLTAATEQRSASAP